MMSTLGSLALLLQAQTAPEITPPLQPPFESLDCKEEKAGAPVILTDAQKVYGVSQIWSLAHHHFPFFDQVPDLDWDAAYHGALEEALEAETCLAYSLVLQRFIAKLNDGHTGLASPSIAQAQLDFVPLELRDVGGRPIVFGKPDGYLPMVPLGSELVRVDGQAIDDVLLQKAYPYVAQSTDHVRRAYAISGFQSIGWGALVGEPGGVAKLEFVTPDGEAIAVDAKREGFAIGFNFTDGEWLKRPLPGSDFEYRWIDESTAYVNLPSFASSKIADQFVAITDELKRAEQVILDLRSNGGGSTGNATRVLSYFADRELPGSAWRTRQTVSSHVAWGQGFEMTGNAYFKQFVDALNGNVWFSDQFSSIPQNPEALKAKLIVLIGRGTASAAEDFLVYADSLPSATFIGSPSFGSTGQPILFELPGGIRGRLVTKRDTFPDGRDFVGFGVQPDILVEDTVSSLLAGEDVVLKRALALVSKTRGEQAE